MKVIAAVLACLLAASLSSDCFANSSLSHNRDFPTRLDANDAAIKKRLLQLHEKLKKKTTQKRWEIVAELRSYQEDVQTSLTDPITSALGGLLNTEVYAIRTWAKKKWSKDVQDLWKTKPVGPIGIFHPIEPEAILRFTGGHYPPVKEVARSGLIRSPSCVVRNLATQAGIFL